MVSRRQWMYGNRCTVEYINGVEEFCKVACEFRSTSGANTIYCPCCDCNNTRKWPDIVTIEDHFLSRGFKNGYDVSYLHGENIEPRRFDSTDVNDGNHEQVYDSDDAGVINNVDVLESSVSERDEDHMSERIGGLQDHVMDDSDCYATMVKAAETPLYPGCDDFSILSAMSIEFSLKEKGNWNDTSFSDLLEALGRMFPKGNDIPKSTYYAKKLMCPLGLEHERIHACPNGCVLFRKEYEHLNKCPICGMSRFRKNEGIVDDDEATNNHKNKSVVKVLWYLPITPRFKRMFSIRKDAKNLRWHAEGRKKDGMISHPADAQQWKEIDTKFPTFGNEARKIRLALCTDGMNPFGSQNSQRSSWPVLLSIYNLPPWLCMRRKKIMMPLLISGPRQPGDDIDVYLAPLIEELKLLWDEGVPMFDANSNSNFILRAMIFCTVNDFPACGNLSGYKVKGEQGCPICEESMQPLYLKHSHKNVFMNHRRFLDRLHPYRRDKRQFNGRTEMGVAVEPRTGVQIYERNKHVKRVHGKGTKSTSKKGILWKKVSILWDLPYWQHLGVRHCLDVMHIEKNVCDSLVGTLLNVPGKTKDGLGVRLDMENQGIRVNLWAEPTPEGKMYLPPACYTMSSTEKSLFYECLYGIKVPSGFC